MSHEINRHINKYTKKSAMGYVAKVKNTKNNSMPKFNKKAINHDNKIIIIQRKIIEINNETLGNFCGK
jgi:hypothetical protein